MIYLPIEQYTNNIKTQYTRWAFPVHNAEITSCYYVSDAYCIKRETFFGTRLSLNKGFVF